MKKEIGFISKLKFILKINILFRHSSIPKAQFNQSTNVWNTNPYSIPAGDHFCEKQSINTERGQQIRHQAKKTVMRTGAPAAKVMRRAQIDALEKYSERDDITEGNFLISFF